MNEPSELFTLPADQATVAGTFNRSAAMRADLRSSRVVTSMTTGFIGIRVIYTRCMRKRASTSEDHLQLPRPVDLTS